MNLKFKGYISSRELNDSSFIPQKVQNLVIRHACQSRGIDFLLSATEYGMKKSFLVLNQTIKDIVKLKINGIAFYSIDQLPNNIAKANKILNTIILSKKNILFSLEDILITNKRELSKVKEIIKIKSLIQFNKSK